MPTFTGIHISQDYIEAAEAKSSEDCRFLGRMPLEKSENDVDFLENVLSAMKSPELGLSFPCEGLALSYSSANDVCKKLHFPYAKEDVQKTVNYEMFAHVQGRYSEDINDITIDHQVLDAEGGSTTVMAVLTKKEFLTDLSFQLEMIDADPEKIIPEISAVEFFVKWAVQPEKLKNLLVVHTTQKEVIIFHFIDGKISDFRQLKINFGELGDVSVIQADQDIVTESMIEEKEQPQTFEFEEDEEEEFRRIGSMSLQELNKYEKQEKRDEAEKDALKRKEETERIFQEDGESDSSDNLTGPELDNKSNGEEDGTLHIIPDQAFSNEDTAQKAEKTDDPDLVRKKGIKRFLIQLKRTMFVLQDEPDSVFITGKFSHDSDLRQALSAFGLPVIENEKKVLLDCPASQGAALSFFDKSDEVLNFRQGDLQYKGFFEKIAFPLNFGVFVLFLITSVLTGFLFFEYKRTQKQILEFDKTTRATFKKLNSSYNVKKPKLKKLKSDFEKWVKKNEKEANLVKIEQKYPVTSCLKVWAEYQKVLNRAAANKVIINEESDITISQQTKFVRLSFKNGRIADHSMLTKLQKGFETSKYFDRFKLGNTTLKNGAVIFSFSLEKDHDRE